MRPNLKLFVAGAVLLLLINHVLTGTSMQASARSMPLVGKNGVVTDAELKSLLDYAAEFPGAETYYRISACYEQRGDLRKALHYYTMAERYAQFED